MCPRYRLLSSFMALAVVCTFLGGLVATRTMAHSESGHGEHNEVEHPPVPPLSLPADQREPLAARVQDCPSEECAGVVPTSPEVALAGVRPRRTRGSNSQLALPRGLLLADINADGASDFLQYTSNKIFVSKTDFAKTGVLHAYLHRPITRVLTGDFHGDGYDQVCAALDTGSLQCFGISTDRRELWWWFTQGVFFGANEDTIVGDFDGDGRDDVMVYPRAGGEYRLYSLKGDFFFGPTPAYSQGNLTGAVGGGMQVRAGDFNADGRADVMLVNSYGQILSYASVNDGTNNTFWWAFTTHGGQVSADDQVTVARVDDNAGDDVVLRNVKTGTTRFFRLDWADGWLPGLGVPTGQINVVGNSLLFWGFMHGALNEPGAGNRDDAMVYDLGSNMFVRSDARWDGQKLTYWWAYTQHAPNNHVGWVSFTAKPWLLLKCKLLDVATEPRDTQFYRNLMYSSLTGYWRSVSYGSWDLAGSTVVDGWNEMQITNANWISNLSRYNRAGACIDAYPGSKAGFVNVISIVNGEGDAGNAGGRVLATPNSTNLSFLAHETGHTFGWGHSFDDTQRKSADWSAPGEYFDHWDIMSAMAVHRFVDAMAVTAGPEMNAPYRTRQSFIPAHRQLRLSLDDVRRGVRTPLAALNRPEANGPLMLRIGDDDNNYYSIEYRMPSGWDQGIPQATVLVHHVRNGTSYLITRNGTERLPGSVSSFVLEGQRFYLRVQGFAAEGYTADVTVDTTPSIIGGIFRIDPIGGIFRHSTGLKLTIGQGIFQQAVDLNYALQEPTNIGEHRNAGLFFQLTARDPETDAEVLPAADIPYEMRISLASAIFNDLDRRKLALHYLQDGRWIKEPTSRLDPATNEVVATPNHFSLWAVLEAEPAVRQHILYLPLLTR